MLREIREFWKYHIYLKGEDNKYAG